MKLITKFLAAGVVASMATTAFAADHRDGPATTADMTADINDVYAFPDGTSTVFAMTVFPFADKTTSKFSDTVKYVFHTSSASAFGKTATGSVDIICTFDTAQKASCWIGNKDYVTGDASVTTGLVAADQKFKVFAGVRADPFYFYLTGFKAARTAVTGLVPSLSLYPSLCPKLTQAQVTTLQTALGATTQDENDFKGANTLAIVVDVDNSLITTTANEVVSVWAATTN